MKTDHGLEPIRDNVGNAIGNCIKCIESAILFEKYDKVKLNSLLLDGVVVNKNETTLDLLKLKNC